MFTLVLLAAILKPASRDNVAALLNVPFNLTHHFGYDGPWQTIPVLVSDPPQLVNLYPGGTYATCIPSINVRNIYGNYSSDDFPPDAGIFNLALADPTASSSSQNFYIAGPNEGGTIGSIDGGLNGMRAAGLAGEGLIITDSLSLGDGIHPVRDVSISAVYNATYTLPNGVHYPLDVGFLSLGASNNQFLGPFTANMVPLNLSAEGFIPSNTWGLHIGSVYPYVPASLVLGGYDQNRVIGNVSMWTAQNQPSDMIIGLLDVSIGVANGGSPFPFTLKSGLLVDAGKTTSRLNVRPNPTVPYLYLPEDTCRAIASYLPVTYMESLDLYSWDTTAPNYRKIVSSPSYLAFTFQTAGTPGNMTINVPFSLLNLTLTPPLVKTPTLYFPCKSYTPPGPNSEPYNEFHLGRAFLQAAFIGMNWYEDVWWMAQAPGPKYLAPFTISLDNSTTHIQSSEASISWFESWSDILVPLPGNGENQTANSTNLDNLDQENNESGLSSGAKAGIGVGTAGGALIVLVVVFFITQHSRKHKVLAIDQKYVPGAITPQEERDHTHFHSQLSRNVSQRQELDSTSRFSEVKSLTTASILQPPILELPVENERR